MKKLFLATFCFIGVLANAQCRMRFLETQGDVFFTPHYGVTNTLGADLTVRISHFRFGGGASVLVDNRVRESKGISYKKSEWSLYGTAGVRVYDVVLGGKIGQIKSEPSEYGQGAELENKTRTLYGGYIGYFVKNNISVNGGWDNLAEWNLSVSFGF